MSELNVSRRQFVRGALVGGAALGLGLQPRMASASASAATAEPGQPSPGKIGEFKISLAEWSLHKALMGKQMTNLDFPKAAREQYGIEAVEFVNQFFKDKAHDSAYLKDLKTRAEDNGVTCVLIMIDGEGDLSAEAKDERDKAVENHKEWVDAAAALGCHSIRVNTGHGYSPTDYDQGGRGLRHTGRVRRGQQDQRDLREPRRPLERPRLADGPDEGGRNSRRSAPCPTSATSPRTRWAATRSTSTRPSPG